jgi:transcriptional regulator with XRE-family HTH domain
MITFEDIWRKLSHKKYREQYALALLKRSVAFQVKTLRKKHCGSQAILAERSHLTQGVVSRAEDQDYGNLTFNTVGRIAAGLDMAFVGKFVPWSELAKFSRDLSEDEFANIPTFDEENARQTSIEQLGSLLDEVPPRRPPQGAADEGQRKGQELGQGAA